MTQYDFGQPVQGIIQIAYTTADIHRTMDHYVKSMGVGPWFLIEHFPGSEKHYRGVPTDLDISLAMAFSGHTLIEVIQQHDDVPSVYRDLVDKRGHGFHHWGVGTRSFEADVERYRGMGYAEAFSCVTPVGDRVAYMDASADLPA